MGDNGLLRSRLREADRSLYDQLMRSWEISTRMWLHLVETSDQSSNSSQHLANDEAHLDQIILACEAAKIDGFRRPLSAIELYILLASVLFHDLGKAKDKQSGPDDKRKHGLVSAERLKGHAHELGTQDREITNSIARISEFHEPDPSHSADLARSTVIEPYGIVREDLLGALLTLADKMDNNFTRMVPKWLSSKASDRPRYHIRSVHADVEARMLRTVISYATDLPKEEMPKLRKKACSFLDGNMKELAEARRILARYGLFIDAWCVDDCDALYNTNSDPTHEPLFDKGFLVDVAQAMWSLATHVFGDNRYTYDDLGSVLGEADTPRLRVAARRISIAAKDAIWAGDSSWEWIAGTSGSGDQSCYSMHLNAVVDKIEALARPTAERRKEPESIDFQI